MKERQVDLIKWGDIVNRSLLALGLLALLLDWQVVGGVLLGLGVGCVLAIPALRSALVTMENLIERSYVIAAFSALCLVSFLAVALYALLRSTIT